MKEMVRYSEAFTLRLVENVADGKQQRFDEAGHTRCRDPEQMNKNVWTGGYAT
jgi:hypothetical protein